MTREQAIALARKHAAKAPHTYTKSEAFMPHEWVINALIEAHDMGESEEFNRCLPETPPGPVHNPEGG